MICLYLAFYFALFQRPESTSSFELLAKLHLAVLALGIIAGIVNFSLAAASVCNSSSVAAAAYVTSFALIVINALTLIGSIIYFLKRTAQPLNQIAAGNEETRALRQGDVSGSDVNTSSQQQQQQKQQ